MIRTMTITHLLSRLGLALLGGLFASGALAQADNPPLWKVGDKVTLFGSFHLLPPAVKWRTPALEQALQESLTVVFETDSSEATGEKGMQPLVVKYGLLPAGQSLSAILPAKTNVELERVAGDLRLPVANLSSMRPWLAGLVLGVQSMINQGYDPAKGVEQQLIAWARQNDKAFASLETLESQIRIFADLTRDEEIILLAVSLRQIREMPGALNDLLAAYRKGDLATLERLLNAGFNEQPALRRKVLGERHRQWLPRIEKMIATGRPHVIVVGAAHLVGPDGLVAMLRAKGHKVEGP